METQGSNFYTYNAYSDVYKKLLSLKNDIRNSYQYDRDETDSIKEIIEIIKSILIMASLEEYFSNNQTDLNLFMGDFSKDVVTYILHQYVVFGDNGHDIALDLLIHLIKLFFKFHKNKEYSTLFENIRKIFDYSASYFSPEHFQRNASRTVMGKPLLRIPFLRGFVHSNSGIRKYHRILYGSVEHVEKESGCHQPVRGNNRIAAVRTRIQCSFRTSSVRT